MARRFHPGSLEETHRCMLDSIIDRLRGGICNDLDRDHGNNALALASLMDQRAKLLGLYDEKLD